MYAYNIYHYRHKNTHVLYNNKTSVVRSVQSQYIHDHIFSSHALLLNVTCQNSNFLWLNFQTLDSSDEILSLYRICYTVQYYTTVHTCFCASWISDTFGSRDKQLWKCMLQSWKTALPETALQVVYSIGVGVCTIYLFPHLPVSIV